VKRIAYLTDPWMKLLSIFASVKTKHNLHKTPEAKRPKAFRSSLSNYKRA